MYGMSFKVDFEVALARLREDANMCKVETRPAEDIGMSTSQRRSHDEIRALNQPVRAPKHAHQFFRSSGSEICN